MSLGLLKLLFQRTSLLDFILEDEIQPPDFLANQNEAILILLHLLISVLVQLRLQQFQAGLQLPVLLYTA